MHGIPSKREGHISEEPKAHWVQLESCLNTEFQVYDFKNITPQDSQSLFKKHLCSSQWFNASEIPTVQLPQV